MPNFQIERLKSLSIRQTSEFWEVAAAPMPMTMPAPSTASSGAGAKAKPEQMVACVCTSSEGGMMMADPQTVARFSDTSGLEALVRFALDPHTREAKPLNYLPAQVRIGPMPKAAQQTLADALGALGVIVDVKDNAPMAEECLLGLAAHLSGFEENGSRLIGAPALGRVKGMTTDRVAAFADAASAFWKAAPWKHFKGEVLWRIDPAPKLRELRYCLVMGGGGQEFGLAFLSDPMQVVAMSASDDPGDYLAHSAGTHWSVMFDSLDAFPAADADFWVKNSLPVADPNAYPMPMGFALASGRVRRPSPSNLTLMEGLLRAFAGLTKSEIRAGGFVRTVQTFEGSRSLSLMSALPMLR